MSITLTSNVRPEKIDQDRKLVQCSDSKLKEKLDKAMDCVLEKLMNNG